MNTTEIELIKLAQDGDEQAFAELIVLPTVASIIRKLTKEYEGRGLYDTESIIYEVLAAKLRGRPATNGMRALEPFEDDKPLSYYYTEIKSVLQDAMSQKSGTGVSPRQYGRYVSVVTQLEETDLELDTLLHKAKLSKSEYLSILALDAGAVDIELMVGGLPSLSDVEDIEVDEILTLLETILEADEQQVLHYKHFHDKYADLSDDCVAEEINRDAGEVITSRATVQRKRTAAIEKVRAHLGITVTQP